MPNWNFLAKTVPEIWTGVPKFKKVGQVTPYRPFDLIFHFSSLVPSVVIPRAKFEVSSSNRSRDMEGVPKFKK